MRQIPAVHAFTGSHPDYHRPSDTADKINAQGGVLVVDLLEKLIRELAVDPQRLVFNPHGVEMHGPGSPGGFRAQLGVMPDYGSMEGDTGCVITAVSPASPAQQAGMQSGDVIVGWNDQHIGNVHDLTAALRHARPGEQVELHILREGRRMTLQVTLGRR